MAALSSGPSWLSPGMVGLSLLLLVHLTYAAPVQESQQTEIDSYFGESTGCYYNYESYHEGDRIITNEPCLNCTCHNRMLMCYLRVCPYTKPIGQDCTVEKREDQCCPVITCPEVPVELLTSTTTASSYETTDVGHLDNYGCSIENKFYSDGAQVPSNPKKPCELCYCIRNMTACVMQECTLHVEGCRPIYQKGVCCPVRYDCDRDNEETLLLDPTTTTERPTPGFLLTTTQQPGAATDCTYENDVYADGALITTVKPCEHCYCMRGDIVCAVQECGTPLENEGKNCTAVPPKHDQCCPDTYECDNATILSITTDVIDSTTLSSGSDSNEDTSIEEESAAQTPLKLDVPSTPAEHEQEVEKEDELPSVDAQSTVTLDEHEIETSSIADSEESIVPTVVAITKSPEEEVIEAASEETTLESESSGEKESDFHQQPEEDVQQQVNPHIIDADILEESRPVHPTHPGFIFEHDAKPTTERTIIEEEILVNKDELKPVIDHTLAPVDADNEIHFTDQHEGSGHHIVSDNQVIEEVVPVTEKQPIEEEQLHEEVQTSVSSPEPVVVDEDEDSVSSSGDGSSTASELEQKPVQIDDEQEHINPIIDHVKDVIGQTILDTDSIDEHNNVLPTEQSISAPSDDESTDVDIGQIAITNETPIDVNKDEEIIHEIDSTEESQQTVPEDNKQNVEIQSIVPVDEVPQVIEADKDVKNIITPEDSSLEPSSHIDTKISEQSVTEAEGSVINQNTEELPEKVTDDNKVISDSDITTIVSIDKQETEQNEDEIIEGQTVIKADLPAEVTDAANVPEHEEVSVSEKIVPIVTSEESTQVQTDEQSITEDSAIISETPLVEEVVTNKYETPLTEEQVTVKSETSLTEEQVTVKSETSLTEEQVTVKSESSLTDEAVTVKSETSLTEEQVTVKSEISLTEEQVTVKSEPSLTEEQVTVKSEPSLTEEQVTVKSEPSLTEEQVTVKSETPLTEEAVTVKSESSLTEEQVTVKSEPSLTEEQVTVKSETPLTDEAVTVKSETPLTEEAVTVKSDTPLTDEAVTVKSETPLTDEAVTVKSDTEESQTSGLIEQESTDSEKPIHEVHGTEQDSDSDQQIIEAAKPSEPSLEQEHITEPFVETQKIDELGESHTQEEFHPTTSSVEEQKQENHDDETQEVPVSSADEHLTTDQKLQNSDSTTSQPEIAHSDNNIETTSSSIITPTENISIESEQPSQSSHDLPVEENVDTKPLKSDKDDELLSQTPLESEDKPIQPQESEPTAQSPVQIETGEPIVYETPVELTTLQSETLVEGDTINADDKHGFQVPEVVSTIETEVSSDQTLDKQTPEISVDSETKKDDNKESTSSETIQTDLVGETESKPENIPTVEQSVTEIANNQEIEPTKTILNKPDETYGDLQTTETSITSNEFEITSQDIDKKPTDDEQTVQKEHEEYIPLIPGEGDCLVDGVTYLNNTSIATVNRCQISCMCISSVIRCESVDCSPPPPNMFRCQPVYHGPDCCPTYMCEGTEAATLESDSHISESYPDVLTPTEITLDISGTDTQDQSTSAPIEAVESPHSPVEPVQKVHVDASVKPPLVKSEESEGPIYRPDIQQVGETDHISTSQQSESETTSDADDQIKASEKPKDSIEIDAEKPIVPELPSSVTPQSVDHSDEKIESSTGNAVEHPVTDAGSDEIPEEDIQTHVVPNIDSDLIVKPELIESDSQSSETDQQQILELETPSPDVPFVTETTKVDNEAANVLNQDDLQIPQQSVDLTEDSDKTTELSNKPDQEIVPVTSDISDEYETSSVTTTILKDSVEEIQEHDSQKPVDDTILEQDIITQTPVLNESEDSHTDSTVKDNDNSQTEEHSIDTPTSIDSVSKPDVEQTVPEDAIENQTPISSTHDLPIEPVVEHDNVDTVQQTLNPEDGLLTVPSDVTLEAETPVDAIPSEESNEQTAHVEIPSSSEQGQQSENDESQKTDNSQHSIDSTDQATTLTPDNASQQQQTDISEPSTSSENDLKLKPDDSETSAISQEQNPTDAPQVILSTETQVFVKPEGDEKIDIPNEHSGNQDTESKPEDTSSQSTIILDEKEILPTTESDDSQKVEIPEEVKADKETSIVLENEAQTHLTETQTSVTPTDEILQVPEKPIDNIIEDTASKPEEIEIASHIEQEEVKADKETNIVLESDAQTGLPETEISLTPTDEILQVPEKTIDNINEDTSSKPEEIEAASHEELPKIPIDNITEVQVSENTDNADDLKTSIKPEKDDSPLTQAPVTAVESEDQGQVAVKPEEDLSLPSVLEESGIDSQSASQPELDKPALHEDDKEVEVSENIQPTTDSINVDSINSVDGENEVDEKPKLPLDEILQTPETAEDNKINHESEKPALESGDKNIVSSETQQPITPTVQSELPATVEDSQKQEPIVPPVDTEIEIQTSAPHIIEIAKPDEISPVPVSDSQVIEADKPVASVDQNEDTTVSVPSDSSTTSELDENLTVTPVKLDDGSEISANSETIREPVISSDVQEIATDSISQEPISGITDDSKIPAELPSITEPEISSEKEDSQQPATNVPELESEHALTDSPIKYNSIDSVDLQTPVDTDNEDEQKPVPELQQPLEDVIKSEVESTITSTSQPEAIEPSVESQKPVEIDNPVILPEETEQQTTEAIASVPQVDLSSEVESEKESTGIPLDTELPSQPISQTDATTALVEEDQSSVKKDQSIDDTNGATSKPTEIQTEVSVQSSETVVPESHSQDTILESTENADKLDDISTPSYEVSEDVQSQQKPEESEGNYENPIEVTVDAEHVQTPEISTNAPLESDSQTLIKDVPTIVESDNVDQVVTEEDSAGIQEILTETDDSTKPDLTSEVDSTSVSYDVQTEISVKVDAKPELSENKDELLQQTNIQTESEGSSESPIEQQTVSIKEDAPVIPDKESQPELPVTYESLPEDNNSEQTTGILNEDLNKSPTQTSSDDSNTEAELTTQQSIVAVTDKDETKLVSNAETELSSASESSEPETSELPDVIEHSDKISESDKINETPSPVTNEESSENSQGSIAPVQIDTQPEPSVDNDSSEITSTPEISSDVDSTDQSMQEGVQQAIPMESDSHLANIPTVLEDDKQSHISSELDVHTDSSLPDVTESVIISHDGKPITPEEDNNLDVQVSVTGEPILESEKLPEVQVTENIPVETSETTSTKIAEPVVENDKQEVQLPEVQEDNEIPEKDVILETKPVQPQVPVLPELIEDNEDAIGQVTEGQVNIKPTDNIINTDEQSQINVDSEITETEGGNVQVTQTELGKPAESDIVEDSEGQVIDTQVQVTEAAQVPQLPTDSILLENNDKDQAAEENISLTDSSSVAPVDAGEGTPASEISVPLSGHTDDETVKPETVTEEEKVVIEGDLTSEQAPTSVPHIEQSVQQVEDVVSTSNDSSSVPQAPETFEHLPDSHVSNESAQGQVPESHVPNESTHGQLPESDVSNESAHGQPQSHVSNESSHGELPESHVSNESTYGQLPESQVSNESAHGQLPESQVSNESAHGQLPESQVSNESTYGHLPESSYGQLPESSYGQLPHDHESHEKPSSSKPHESHSPSSHTDDNAYENSFPSGSYGQAAEEDYEEDEQTPFGPGTCRYGGKVYVSAQQIPRDDPCDFCFCFRSDIICLQQSCPPPIPGCHEEPIQGFCCPRYECHVSMATMLNVTTTTTTSTTALPPHFLSHAYHGAATRRGCQINGQAYQVGEVVRSASGPCLHCTCGGDGQMKCDPKVCSPEPMLRQMIAAAAASRRRR